MVMVRNNLADTVKYSKIGMCDFYAWYVTYSKCGSDAQEKPPRVVMAGISLTKHEHTGFEEKSSANSSAYGGANYF